MQDDDIRAVRVNKLDAALRQLRAAIRLWYHDGDPVAIHTLASASHQVIDVLYRRAGLTGLLFDNYLVKSEERQRWARHIVRFYNFFKHADRDPDEVVEFNPEINDWLMVNLCAALQRLKVSASFEELAFTWWMIANNKGLAADEFTVPEPVLQFVLSSSKQKFFDGFEQTWRSNAT